MANSGLSISDILAADSMAADMEQWIVFTPGITERSIDSWLEENLPSQTSRADGIGWIAVSAPRSGKEDEVCDPQGLQDSFQKLKQSGREISLKTITELAKIHHVLHGKWLFHASTGLKIDHLWSIVARATASGKLGTSAKVSTLSTEVHDNKHVVCMYVADFTNEESVMKLESDIRSVGIKAALSFKPDVYTYIGIYRQNPYGLRPTIYQSRYNILEGRSHVTVPSEGHSPDGHTNMDWRSTSP